MTIVFSISGHGFGHASRDLEVVDAILRHQPDARIVVRSSVPQWFLDGSSPGRFEIQPAETDTGVVQIDSLHLDEDETARRAASFYQRFDERVRIESERLRELRADVIVGDIPPLAFAAAHQCGVPSVALGNFTWDWIYRDYPRFESIAPGVIATIRDAYATATRAFRLPFHGGFEPMQDVTLDIPLIARKTRRSRQEARRLLHLPSDRPIVIASFGGHGLPMPYAEIARAGHFTLIVTDYEAGGSDGLESPLVRFTLPELAAQGLRYPDLVAASDVVVTKLGYGIVSECIVHDTAMLYTPRGRFAEQEVFTTELPSVLRCRQIDQSDLLAGRWADEIDALLRQPRPARKIASNGAEAAAEAILGMTN